MGSILFEYDDETIIGYYNIDDRKISAIDRVTAFTPGAIFRDLTERRYVMDDGTYCWQECCSTEMCKKCLRLNNGETDYLDNTFLEGAEE